jgi:alkanesulfonate monooxygenase SsuD/methylene tetrahydromethanopterin reductase-like flavin-dependent oxidoreductase (luciferase family)
MEEKFVIDERCSHGDAYFLRTASIPSDLFARITEAAQAKGQDPDKFALAALTAIVVEPAWKERLRRSQERARVAFQASGMTDDELAEDIEKEVKAYRAELHDQEAQR